jgi:hypothetical protein
MTVDMIIGMMNVDMMNADMMTVDTMNVDTMNAYIMITIGSIRIIEVMVNITKDDNKKTT